MKETKEGRDFKEIDLLARQSKRHARIGKFSNGGNEADLNPNVANRNSGPRKPPEKTCLPTSRWRNYRRFSTAQCLATSASGGMQATSTAFATY